MKLIYTLVFLFLSSNLVGQDLGYVKAQAKILSASDMYGRGYVKKGMAKAAKHIANEFKAIGLEYFNGSPYQNFTYDVNSFCAKQKFSVNEKELVAGQDYLISPDSGSDKFSGQVVRVDKDDIGKLPHPKDIGNKIIMLDPLGIEDKDSIGLFYQLREQYAEHMPVIWVNNNRLLWSVARRKMNHPVIEVNPGLIAQNDRISLV